MFKTVILIGSEKDKELRSLNSHLLEKGATIVWWNSDEWPGKYPFSLQVDGNSSSMHVKHKILEHVDSVYIRNLNTDPKLSRFESSLNCHPFVLLNQLDETRSLLFSGLEQLESSGAVVVNPLSTMSTHSLKPMQMNAFQRINLPVPETLVTSEPTEVKAFFERNDEEVIYKPLSGGGYVRRLTREDLSDERLALLANSPVMFQRRIYGDNLRLYILDGKLIAAGRVITDNVDYRTQEHDVEILDPEKAIVEAAVQATKLLGLIFSGVDVIQSKQGYVLLEANPAPMFAEFDKRCGSHVASSLASYLYEPCHRSASC